MSHLYRLRFTALFRHTMCQTVNIQKSILISDYSPPWIQSAAREREQCCSSGGKLSLIVQVHITHWLWEGGEYWKLASCQFNTDLANRTVHEVWPEKVRREMNTFSLNAQCKRIQITCFMSAFFFYWERVRSIVKLWVVSFAFLYVYIRIILI